MTNTPLNPDACKAADDAMELRMKEFFAGLMTNGEMVDVIVSAYLAVVQPVVNSPKPHDATWWIENANVNDWEDCEACAEHEYDLCPVHHGMTLGQMHLSKALGAICEDNELLNYIPTRLMYTLKEES